MAMTHDVAFRLVGTVSVDAVVEELVQSAPHDVVSFVVAVVAEMGEDVRRDLVGALNEIEWIEAEEEEVEPDEA